MKAPAWAAAAVSLGLVACGSSAAPSSSSATPSGTAAFSAPLVQHDYCTAGQSLHATLQGLQNSTLTTSEVVGQLAAEQGGFAKAAEEAQVLRPGDTQFVSAMTALATAVGHLKVALDSGGDPSGPIGELGVAVSGAPSCG